MNKAVLSTLGSLISAFFASLCCIGPFVFSLIGASILGFATVFIPYRPYLMGITVLFLGAGFYFTYRKREVRCEDGTCKVNSPSKLNQVLLWIAAVVVLVFMFFPQIVTVL